jgi:hypothetical protein
MVKLNPSEMHLLVLICTNPDHPQTLELLRRLGDDARAIAILILRSMHPSLPGLPRNLPAGIATDASRNAEIRTAAKEFARMMEARRGEHALRANRMPVHA